MSVLLPMLLPGAASAAQQRQRITVLEVAPLILEPAKPAWAADGIPDTVRVLLEASSGLPADDERWQAMLDDAEAQARSALAEQDDVARRFGLAVVLGVRANRQGGRAGVRTASDLQKELEIILELSPDHARARHLMGRLHAGVRRMNRVTRWLATNLLGGGELKKATWELAEANLLFAEQRVPEVSDHHLQLANLYRDTDRPELALEEVRHVLAMRPASSMERAVFDEAVELEERLMR